MDVKRQSTRAVKATNFYANVLMREWRIGRYSRRVQTCVARVLDELSGAALLTLRKEPRLEVRVIRENEYSITVHVRGGRTVRVPGVHYSIWAYFPVHRRRRIARLLRPKPSTKILLVISEPELNRQPLRTSKDELRDHLGHTLLYLRNPKAPNECDDAWREWRANVCDAALKA